MKVEGITLVLAQGPMIQLSEDVTRYVAYDETDDLVLVTAFTAIQSFANCLVERRGRESGPRYRHQIDPAACRQDRMEFVNTVREVVLDYSFALEAILALLGKL